MFHVNNRLLCQDAKRSRCSKAFGRVINKRIIQSFVLVAALCMSASSFSMDIFDAIEYGNYKEVEQLIKDKKVDLNKVNDNGETPLSWACWNNTENNFDILKLLLENGADVNEADRGGETQLHLACWNNNTKLVTLLLEYGAKESVNKANDKGETPIYLACKNDDIYIDIVKLLLENGAKESINKDCNKGFTPSDKAFNSSDLGIIKLLLENGVCVDKEPKCYYYIIKSYIDAVLQYDAQETDKLQFILDMRKKKKKIFNFLVRVAFGRMINKFVSLKSTTFFKLYNLKDVLINFDIFDVHKQKDIFEFIKEVLKDKNKNFFIMGGSFLRKYEYTQKLNAKRNENKLIDCAIKTVY